ncbi:MAG: hypothetical protein ACFNM7_12365, partial [Prevotella conceptionensis]
DQLNRFQEQQAMRDSGDDEAQMLDMDFVEMLEYGMPPACGWGNSERLTGRPLMVIMVGSSWACATKAQNSNATEKALRIISYRLSGENFSPTGIIGTKPRTARSYTLLYIHVIGYSGRL